MKIYLASQSPRRKVLLTQLGLNFDVLDMSIDESRNPEEPAQTYVKRVALDKARCAWDLLPQQQNALVLAADTCIVVGNKIIGKPCDRQNALQILQLLSGRKHYVYTAVAAIGEKLANAEEKVAINKTEVEFRNLTLTECAAYWDCGEPVGKAGAYAIQGKAAIFIENINGSYSGVMGLPLFETAQLLKNFGIAVN